MSDYQEPEKQKARNEALRFAVRTLTTNRHKSSIARRTYVREVKQHLQNEGSEYDKKVSSFLTEGEIKQWETFYDSIIGKKKASQLRVAYLSGPNPINDIEVLVKLGILPENIWAFESNKGIYDKAILTALDSQFPFVKIYKGKIETYLKALPFQFDIVYLDFCKTIASSNTMSVVKEVFLQNKLSSLGVMITNFSLPNTSSKENVAYRKNLNLIAANYLYPKSFTEEFTKMGGSYRESAEVFSLDHHDFMDIASQTEETFYSQLITRMLYDLSGTIIPYQRLASNESLHKLFFKNFDKNPFKDALSMPNENSLEWGLTNQYIDDKSFDKIFNRLLRQLSINSNEKTLQDQIKLVHYFKRESGQADLHSDGLEKIRKNWDPSKKYIFCDLFMFQQLKDILIGQLTSPYFYNVDYTKRWMYKAKDTDMFMDLITYDQCRYIFDWMPTLDMLEEGVDNWDRQLSLRFAMDAISKQRRWYNLESFFGTAVVSGWDKGFEAKDLKKRKIIK